MCCVLDVGWEGENALLKMHTPPKPQLYKIKYMYKCVCYFSQCELLCVCCVFVPYVYVPYSYDTVTASLYKT